MYNWAQQMSAQKPLSRRQKWSLDSTRMSRTITSNDTNLASPPGYNTSGYIMSNEVTKRADTSQVIRKKLWEVALAPMKQVPMNLLIMYMAGNSISIFPVMMVGMQLMRQIQALFSINNTFKMVGDSSSSTQKFVYLMGHFINIALSIYKCHSMGLLPTHSSDWLAFVEPQERQEFLGGGVNLL